jgi:hypothetical protein
MHSGTDHDQIDLKRVGEFDDLLIRPALGDVRRTAAT